MITYTTRPRCVNGLFCVPKPDGSLRLIVDGRPACVVFDDPPPVQLPGPDLLARLEVPRGSRLYVGKSDLSDFFYRFKVPSWMTPFFALPPVQAASLGGSVANQFGDVRVWPCLQVLAMGWSHSVFVTQMAHQRFLDTGTTLQPADRITTTSDLCVDRLRHGVYIDDVIVVDTA